VSFGADQAARVLPRPGPGGGADRGRPRHHHRPDRAAAAQPRSRGAVTLRSADPFDRPAIDLNAFSDPDGEDLQVLTEGVNLAQRLLRTAPLRPLLAEEPTPSPHPEEIRAFIRAHAQTTYHATSTCRMGTDELGVVDPELRVHGIDGLRVVDASVLPVINRGHPNAPIIMLAEKAADLLRARHPTC
jgi:choline dehydrogenase